MDNSQEELLKKLALQISSNFQKNEEEEKRQQEQARKVDQELLCNRIAPHLSQWYMAGEPVSIGKNFVVIRSWQKHLIKDDSKYRGRQPIIIDPGIAFGWAHPTTTLSLEILEEHWKGERMLDIGTGTGILAIAGVFLQPTSHIDAYDISLDIIESAEFCLEINGVLDKINLKQADITDYQDGFYDLITANLLPNVFVQLKERIVSKLKPGGKLIISGFSDKAESRTLANFDWVQTVEEIEDNDVATMFEKLGLKLVDKRKNKDWLALIMQKPKIA